MQVIAIYGPTASGKSSLALEIHKKSPNNTLLISVDSRKAYKYLDIGTNKLKLLKNSLTTHLIGIDLFEPTQNFTVADFRELVYNEIIKSLKEKQFDKIIFFGGSGLFLDAIIFGLKLKPGMNDRLRDKLNSLSINKLQNELLNLSKNALLKMNESDRVNKFRLIRQIETLMAQKNKYTYTSLKDKYGEGYYILKDVFSNKIRLITTISIDRVELYKKIDLRVDTMFKDGWIKETKQIIHKYYNQSEYNFNHKNQQFLNTIFLKIPALKIMGYKSIVEFLYKKNESLEALKAKIKQKHRNYAKLQISWAKRYQKVINNLDSYYPEREFSPDIKSVIM